MALVQQHLLATLRRATGDRNAQQAALEAAAHPFLFDLTPAFARELMQFVAGGLSIVAADRAVWGFPSDLSDENRLKQRQLLSGRPPKLMESNLLSLRSC